MTSLTRALRNEYSPVALIAQFDKLISPLQQGFLPSRSILTNPLIIDHLLHQSSSSIAFIDFEKAFDSISHKSIIKALYAFNFPSKFIRAIKNIQQHQ